LGKELLIGHSDGCELRDVVFDPEGDRIATAGVDGRVLFWSTTTGKRVQEIEGIGHSLARVCFSHDGALVATAGWGDACRIWDSRTGERVASLAEPNAVASVAFSADDQLVATGEFLFKPPASVHLWDYQHPEKPHATCRADSKDVQWADFSGDGTLLSA